MIKKAFGFFLILVITVAGGSLWHRLTAGFRLNKIEFTLPKNPEWSLDINEERFAKVQKILDQEFTYLAKGRQSYVFESADKQYVIKFFRYHLIRPRIRHFLLQFPKSLDDYRKKKFEGKRNQFKSWMDSYTIAFKHLQEESGIIYMHLMNEGDLQKQIKIKDKVGREFTLDADKTGFLIQKRVDLFFDRVIDLTSKRDFTELERVIKAYFQTVGNRFHKGVKNKDHSWVHNYGIFGNDEVYEIDAGRYSYYPPPKDQEHMQITLMRFTYQIQEYFHANIPEFMPTFNRLLIAESKKHYPEESPL